jgi:RNA polymerase sigma-70 factor (ECF subfamily)
MQEVSVIAWRKFGQLDDAKDFRRWVCVIARYEVLMHRRKKARDRLVLGEELEQLVAEEGLDELDLREQQLEALEGCLGKLPKERRRLVLHVYAAEYPMKTVAQQIGKTPEALYKLLSRVRRQLLQCVEHTLAEAEL